MKGGKLQVKDFILVITGSCCFPIHFALMAFVL